MGNRPALTPEQREFFSMASAATFANPFGSQRYELDAALAGVSFKDAFHTSPNRPETLARLLARLRRKFGELGQGIKFSDYTGRDRDILMHAMLFDTFLHYAFEYDALIEAQLEAGDQPLEVPFAKRALAHLRKWGFSREQSTRFFGILYQITRGYYFISRYLPGSSDSMITLRQRLWDNIFTSDLELYENYMWSRMEDFSTFLMGETGTGKGTAARALGLSGWIPFDESKGRFADSLTQLLLPINLSQFTESLIESELFGHKKGAFTGAIKEHQGVFERCRRYGTIFLDEIGEVSIPVQIKLLNVLQERTFTPVGSHKPLRFEGRVVAATNRPVEEHIEDGSFRADFFYRLCSDIIVMPTLRQRITEDPSELDGLLSHIIERIVGQPMPQLVARVSGVIEEKLGVEYEWRGNVRELEQCVRRVMLTGTYEPERRAVSGTPAQQIVQQLQGGELTAAALMSRYCTMMYKRLGSYEAVGEVLEIDRRTVKKYVSAAE